MADMKWRKALGVNIHKNKPAANTHKKTLEKPSIVSHVEKLHEEHRSTHTESNIEKFQVENERLAKLMHEAFIVAKDHNVSIPDGDPEYLEKVELKQEVHEVLTPLVEEEETLTEYKPPSLIDQVSDQLSYVAARTKNTSGQVEINEIDSKFENIEFELSRMRRTILENTVVSGIGQGGDGQSPGSGVVRAVDLDDVIIDGINPGDTIIWDGNNFVPGQGGTGGGTVTTADVNLTNPTSGAFQSRTTVLHPNFPMAGDYNTQEDANILFTECLNYLELGKAHISVGPDIPDDEFVTIGDLYVDETYDMFVYNGNTWVQVGGGGASGVDQDYVDEQDELRVLKSGDTMTGDLQFKSLTAENYLKIVSKRPDGWSSSDALFGLEINLADGNTYKNQLRVRGRSDKDIVRLWIQDEPRVETTGYLNIKPPANLTGNSGFVVCRDTDGKATFSVGANGTVRAGTEPAPFIASRDHHLVTKKFSDERLQDVQNQIDNLEASNLSTTTLNYTYVTGTPGAGEFTTNNAAPGSVTQFNIDTRDTANRVLPDLNNNDVITTRLGTGTAPVQTFTVADGSDPAAVTVVGQSTTANDYTDGETYILTVGHSFDGFATTEYVDTKVAITGDTMTGPLILSGNPGTGLQAATKDYVDNAVSGSSPDLADYVKADGSVPMTGTFNARNIDIGNNASLMFSAGNQYIKTNNGRTLGIYAYLGTSFTGSHSKNIDITNNLTTLGATTKCSSNLISTRSSGYAFEVKPGDVNTVGYWHSNGTMILRPQTTNTSVAFAVYPKGLSSTNSNVALYVSGDGNVRLGTAITIDHDLDVVSKRYVDQNFIASSGGKTLDDYLPLAGGTLTGTTRIEGASFFVNNSAGEEVIRFQETGFIRTFDLFRSQRTDNGPAFQARDGSTLMAEIKCDGTATFKSSVKKDSKELATEEYVDNAVQLATVAAVPATMDFQWRSTQSQNLSNGQFKRAGNGSQVNISYQTFSGMVWCDTTTLSGDQNMEALFSVYKKEGNNYILKLCLQVQQITFGYRPDSYSIRRLELKKTYNKMGSYDALNDYGLYYITVGGLF